MIESRVGNTGFWAVRFADKIHNVRATGLEALSNRAAFEPTDAPVTGADRKREKKLSKSETSKRGLSLAASTSRHVQLMAGKMGPAFAF